ncbi:stressosome-associated protein Prli42 [Bacillaceae bacterium S4-13-58]
MAKVNKHQHTAPKKKSKRERRQKVIVYLMIISMVLSTLVAGASFFL